MDVSPLRIHLTLTTVGPVNEDGTPADNAKCIVKTAGYSCVDHPEFGWQGDQWQLVLDHLAEAHTEKPFRSTAKAGEYVSVSIEAPST